MAFKLSTRGTTAKQPYIYIYIYIYIYAHVVAWYFYIIFMGTSQCDSGGSKINFNLLILIFHFFLLLNS